MHRFQVAKYLRETVGASVQEFPLAYLEKIGDSSPASVSDKSASDTNSLSTLQLFITCFVALPFITFSGGPRVRVERILFRWLCMANATTEADVELLHAAMPQSAGYYFPGPRGWDTRLMNLRDLLLDIQEDVQMDRRTRERLIFGLSPKWSLIKQILFPFLRVRFDSSVLSMEQLF